MKTHLITISLLLIGFYTQAQEQKLQQAFAESYKLEQIGNYTAAAGIIADNYVASRYECNLRLAYLKYMSAAYSESMNYYQKAIALMPYAIEPKLGYVLPAAALGKWDDVVTQYLAILKIDPKNTSIAYKLGTIYYNRKKYNDAAKQLEKVVNLYPFDYDGLMLYAWTNYRLGKYNEAKILFNKVLLLSPSDKSALEGLSMIK
jgi:tetratricopeptide (TPR) repeat protein